MPGKLSDAQALTLLERLAAKARAALTAYDQIPRPVEADTQASGVQRERFFWQLTLEYGIMSARMDLEWFESVIARIKRDRLPGTSTAS